MKKILNLLLISFIFIISPVYASTNTYERTEDNYRVDSWVNVTDSNRNIILTTPSVDESEKVYDFANLLDENEEKLILNSINEFISKYDMDMVIVTIDSNPRYSAQKFSDDFYDYNSFGKNKTRDGVLFLIDMDTRNFYISTTGEAIRLYNDYRINAILDYVEPYIKDENYYEAASSFIQKSAYYANSGIPSGNVNSYINEKGDIVYYKKINYFFSVVGSLIITAIVIAILVNKNKMIKKATNANLYFNKDLAKITEKNDRFLTTHTTSVSLSSSSGGSGSGSSTHSSSSGSSHGGGGRSF